MNFSICIFKEFLAYFLGAAIRNALNGCFCIKHVTIWLILIIILLSLLSEAYSELSQTSKMQLFAKIVTGFKTSNIFAKVSILDVCLVFQFASEYFVDTYDRFVYLRRKQLMDKRYSPLARKHEIYQVSGTSTIRHITCDPWRIMPGKNWV